MTPEPKPPAAGYRPFATIRLACASKVWNNRFIIEVDRRSNGKTTSLNLDDFPSNDSDLAERIRLAEVQKELPSNGRIIVTLYTRGTEDFLESYVLTLKNKQVVAIEGEPWEAPPPPAVNTPPAALRKEATVLVQATVQSLLKTLRHSTTYAWNGENAPAVKISFSPARKLSRGNATRLSFALHHWLREGELLFKEYASFRGDPEIGEVRGPWQRIVKAIVAHELAHWACKSAAVEKPRGLDCSQIHGKGFREIYRYLRIRVERDIKP